VEEGNPQKGKKERRETHEVLNVPLTLEENGETTGESDDDGTDESDPGRVRLEGRLPGERVATDPLNLASACKLERRVSVDMVERARGGGSGREGLGRSRRKHTVEANEDEAKSRPSEETSDGRKVLNPGESLGRTTGAKRPARKERSVKGDEEERKGRNNEEGAGRNGEKRRTSRREDRKRTRGGQRGRGHPSW
jgi:hypothetical protein